MPSEELAHLRAEIQHLKQRVKEEEEHARRAWAALNREGQWHATLVRWLCNTCGDFSSWVTDGWSAEVKIFAARHVLQKSKRPDGTRHQVLLMRQQYYEYVSWEAAGADAEAMVRHHARLVPRGKVEIQDSSVIEWGVRQRKGKKNAVPLQRLVLKRPALSGRRLPGTMIGTPASPGTAVGLGYWMDEPRAKFPRGAIMLSRYTTPAWTIHMARMAGIVTSVGGYTGHAPTVAREMGKPAVIGIAEQHGRGDEALKKLHGSILKINGDTGTVEVLEE